jgi:ubiquitin-protein ligase
MENPIPSKRLQRELELSKDLPPNVKYYPKDEKLMSWDAEITGLPGSFYEGFILRLSITIPTDYPNKPPNILFKHQIWHPNVNLDHGTICVDILKDAWSPVLTLNKLLLSICLLLDKPNPDSALNGLAARQFNENINAYKLRAQDVCLLNCKKI